MSENSFYFSDDGEFKTRLIKKYTSKNQLYYTWEYKSSVDKEARWQPAGLCGTDEYLGLTEKEKLWAK